MMKKCNVVFVFVPDACRKMCVSFLHLLAKHRALQLPCYLFSSLVETSLEYRRICSKKMFYKLLNSYCNSVNCCYKTRFFRSILLLSKSQQMGILQRLVDKCSHLFFCNSLKQTFRYLDSFLSTADSVTTSSSAKQKFFKYQIKLLKFQQNP